MSSLSKLLRTFPTLIVLAGLAIVAMAALYLLRPTPELPEARTLSPVSFSDLTGWAEDDQTAALGALRRSCTRWAPAPEARPLLPGSGMGTVADWREVCRETEEILAMADTVPTGGSAPFSRRVRAFFEARFQPFAVSNNNEPKGLFTAYFLIEVAGSRTPLGPLSVPLYARPPDLVQVNLGLFRPVFTGRDIAGRVEGGRLVPYPPRGQIDDGALSGKGLEIVWVDNPVDAFFLHIQGSGRVKLPGGSVVGVGYDGTNGHPYTTVGGLMIERGLLPSGGASMGAIRDWIAANPVQGAALMAENARYVFFRPLEGDAPIGAQGAPLTDGRSLAIDRKYLPLGVPMWVETMAPTAPTGAAGAGTGGGPAPFRRLMVAQDTGGAIIGPVRGDIYWGTGPEAGAIAGRMKYPGRYYVLLPNAVAERLRGPK